MVWYWFFFFQAEDGIRDDLVTGVQTCALPILKLFKMAFPLEQKLLGLRNRDFVKANAISGAKLRGNWKIDCDHVRDFWITADRLTISKQENRLAAPGNLNRPGRNTFRAKIDMRPLLQHRRSKANAHAIRAGGDSDKWR